jgi:GGDEF domain-containing protein
LLTVLAALLGGYGQYRAARRAALHDDLTGLPNQALLRDRMSAALQDGRHRPGRCHRGPPRRRPGVHEGQYR